MKLVDAKNNKQNMMKICNNSLSGTFAKKVCILYNPTTHSTLTSIVRTMTSLSNANNEKLIAGNRYYPRGIYILNNIVYIIIYTNTKKIEEIVTKNNLHLPTVSDAIEVMKYSSDLYFIDSIFYNNKIIPFLNMLSPYELAAICYIGDLYHIRKFNSLFIINILTEFIQPVIVEKNNPNVVFNIR
jgi:hypothetical protein